MKFRTLRALLIKEVLLMKRNPLIPKIVFIMPVMVMLVLPLIANLDVKRVMITVVDNDRSQLSRRIVSDLSHADGLHLLSICMTHAEAIETIERGEADVVLTIPLNYSRNLLSGSPQIDIEANGVNATKGSLGAQYTAQSVAATLSQWQREQGISPFGKATVSINAPEIINLYNPTLNFHNYMIPALMVVLIIIICGFLPALNLVSEKETGTIEAMNVTPVGKLTFVLSKLIPFWIVGLIIPTVGMLIGWLVYGLVPAGNIGAAYLAAILFTLVMSALGVFIANISSTMLQSIFVMFAFIIIFQLMGGLFTPISSMPDWAQYITYAVPPRYFIEIIRAVYLKGTSIAELWPQYSALAAYAVLLFLLVAITYKKHS